MRRLRRLGRKVVDGLRSAKSEASHPGRPPSYKATDSPFWDEPALKSEELKDRVRKMDEAKTPENPSGEDEAQGGNLRKSDDEELPWYLEGDDDLDGWDNTNGKDG